MVTAQCTLCLVTVRCSLPELKHMAGEVDTRHT